MHVLLLEGHTCFVPLPQRHVKGRSRWNAAIGSKGGLGGFPVAPSRSQSRRCSSAQSKACDFGNVIARMSDGQQLLLRRAST
eukprot:297923-Amphidinium_carterae.2